MKLNILAIFLISLTFFCFVESKEEVNRYFLTHKPSCTLKRQTDLEWEMKGILPLGTNSTYRFPESISEAQAYCKELHRITDKSEKFFVECYNKTVKDLMKLFVYTIRQNLKKHCTITKTKQSNVIKEVIKHAPCSNKHIRPDPKAYNCLNQLINKSKQLVYMVDQKKKTPHFCCYAVEYQKCVRNYFQGVSCLKKHVTKFREMINSESSGFSGSMCNEYNDQTDACAKLGPPPPPPKKNNKTYITIVSLFIDLLESMDFQ